jgi:hypothetical protein
MMAEITAAALIDDVDLAVKSLQDVVTAAPRSL